MSGEKESPRWFDGFVGVGYYLRDVRPKLLVVFDKRKRLADAWNKVIKWWPEDDIRIIFAEHVDSYRFIMYCTSAVRGANFVFVKSLPISANYQKFLTEFEGVLNLGLALQHNPSGEEMEIEIFNYKRRIANVRIISENKGFAGLDEKELEFVSKSKQFFESALEAENQDHRE